MRKPGRNDPCPCGSGRKYKRCCLPRDEERRARLDTFHARFEEGSDEERPVLLAQALEDGLLDAESAFDMVGDVRYQARYAGDHRRAVEIVECLRQLAPEAYEANRAWYDCWLIEDTVALGSLDDLPRHLELYASGKGDIDLFFRIMDLLMYRGHTQPLLEAMRQAWPSVRKSPEIVPWGIDEFAETAVALIIYDYVDRADDPRADDPALLDALSPFCEVGRLPLSQILNDLLGRSAPAWTPREFLYRPRRRSQADDLDARRRDRRWEAISERLYFLSLHLLRDLRRRVDMSWGRAEIGRRELIAYLSSRCHVVPQNGPVPLLHPRPESLDEFAGRYFDFVSPQPYRAAALTEILPAYLDFLCRHGLMEPSHLAATLGSLQPLASTMIEALERSHRHTAMISVIREQWNL